MTKSRRSAFFSHYSTRILFAALVAAFFMSAVPAKAGTWQKDDIFRTPWACTTETFALKLATAAALSKEAVQPVWEQLMESEACILYEVLMPGVLDSHVLTFDDKTYGRDSQVWAATVGDKQVWVFVFANSGPHESIKKTKLNSNIILAQSQSSSICGARDDFVGQLERKYSESFKAMGLVNNGSVLEVLTSPTGSWSILVTTPQGVTCLVTAGENWEDVKKQKLNFKPSL